MGKKRHLSFLQVMTEKKDQCSYLVFRRALGKQAMESLIPSPASEKSCLGVHRNPKVNIYSSPNVWLFWV